MLDTAGEVLDMFKDRSEHAVSVARTFYGSCLARKRNLRFTSGCGNQSGSTVEELFDNEGVVLSQLFPNQLHFRNLADVVFWIIESFQNV